MTRGKPFVLDEYNSCILEYSTAFKNPTGAYVSGRFYTRTNHKDFSEKSGEILYQT